MTTTPLDRLLFAQGGECFFCEKALPRGEASVEHLVAQANGGPNNDANCVACCKTLNALLGSMALKEKFRVVLNQRGRFVCPKNRSADGLSPLQAAKNDKTKEAARPSANTAAYDKALANLKSRGNSSPMKSLTLRSTIAAVLPGLSSAAIESVVAELKAAGKLSEHEGKVSYSL